MQNINKIFYIKKEKKIIACIKVICFSEISILFKNLFYFNIKYFSFRNILKMLFLCTIFLKILLSELHFIRKDGHSVMV